MQGNSEYFLQQREIEYKVYDTRKKKNAVQRLLEERNFINHHKHKQHGTYQKSITQESKN
jgi:hypothetical protein